jgi:ribosome biogenesis protein UTP30
MSQDELVDSHVSEHQCQLAIEALLSHELKKRREAEESELLPEKEKDIWLVLAVKKFHPVRKIKPFKMYVLRYPDSLNMD